MGYENNRDFWGNRKSAAPVAVDCAQVFCELVKLPENIQAAKESSLHPERQSIFTSTMEHDNTADKPLAEGETATATIESKPQSWVTVVHNDPVNLMTYVQWIFETYFNMDANLARMKMLQVHHEGRAVVARGAREQMERDAQAMHTYGLWATIEPEASGK